MRFTINKIKKTLIAGGVSTAFFAFPAFAEDEFRLHPSNPGRPEVKISGLLETEAGFSNTKEGGDSNNSSDTVLATIELHFDAQLSDMVRGHVMLLHEEDDTPMEFDEGTITIGKDEGLSLTTGQMYLPFGVFDTNMVSDPMTLEMGETRESAIMLSYKTNGVSGSVYLFNGNIHQFDTTKLEHKGFRISYEKEQISFGLDYISSVAESEVLQAAMLDPNPALTETTYLPIDKFVAGSAIHAIYRSDTFSIIVERVAAVKKFAATDAKLANKKPITGNVEAAYQLARYKIAIGLQGSKDAEGLFAKQRVLAGVSRDIFEKVGLNMELAKTTEYDKSKTDTTLTAQLAIEF